MFTIRMLLGGSALCLTLLHAPAGAQTFTEGSTTSTTPPPANSVAIEEVTVPPKSPPYLLSTYRSSLLAPLPAKIWKQGGIPAVINQSESFRNPHGRIGNYSKAGPTITANNAFFQSLGTNGRSCVTCHNPPSGMGLALTNIKSRFRTNINDPLFAPVDGANCPSAVPVQYTSGSLYGGIRGKGKRALKDAYSLLLTKGLIRIPIKVPAVREYEVEVISDALGGCNKDPNFNKDPVTGEQILSMHRRPIFSAGLLFKSDGQTAGGAPTNVMWDGREPSLRTQAVSATLGHAQAAPSFLDRPDLQTLIDQIVDFETKFFSAQIVAKVAGRLDANATGGPVHLAAAVPNFATPPGTPAFDEYNNWANLTGNAKAERQASIARGQAIFNNRHILVANVGGFNDLFLGAPFPSNPIPPVSEGGLFPVTCSLCHGMPHAGSELVFPPHRDIGTGGQAAPGQLDGAFANAAVGVAPSPAKDLPLFKVTCHDGKEHPFYGKEILTNDPATGLITGKCADIGKKTVPAIRGLASRAPFFSDGSAKDLNAVVNFYDQRFAIGLTAGEKADLVNFLAAL